MLWSLPLRVGGDQHHFKKNLGRGGNLSIPIKENERFLFLSG
ncbi:MAG: hypothetical protein ACI9NQ_002012 [Paracoccaceae bacterium]|jgi:hypothetical protein